MNRKSRTKTIAIMDIFDKDGRCTSVGCRHKYWQEGAEQPEVCDECLEAVKSGKELRAQMYDHTGEIKVILGE